MGEKAQILFLKNVLKAEIAAFCRSSSNPWKEAVSATVNDIRQKQWQAVFFGGTLRSLLWSRVRENVPGRPRDVDIVTEGARLDDLEKLFRPYIVRHTRFGGLKLERVGSLVGSRKWEFDIWPLEETFALKESGKKFPNFRNLPETTFFNVESIAVDIWARRGSERRVFSKDDQFFKGIIQRTLEVNKVENPFPDLCVVRALVMAAQLEWKIGPKLLQFLGDFGLQMSATQFETIQETHYGAVRLQRGEFKRAMEKVTDVLNRGVKEPVELMLPSRLALWPEDEEHANRLWIRSVIAAGK